MVPVKRYPEVCDTCGCDTGFTSTIPNRKITCDRCYTAQWDHLDR